MHLRKATFGDVEAIHKLVNDYAQQGVMLPRSRNSIYETLRDVIIAEEEGQLIGVGSLHLSWDALAEVRALAIAPDFHRRGIGRQIVEALLAKKGKKMDDIQTINFAEYKRQQYDILADSIRENLDMKKIYEILEAGV